MGKKYPLKVGEKVFFIPHGVGVVDRYETKDIMGETKDYMIVKIMATDMTVMLPLDEESYPNSKIRKISSKKQLKEAYKILEEDDTEIEKNWKTRKENNQQRLSSGDLTDFAEIVKTLYEKNKEKPLSYTEKNLIKKVFSFLVNEVSIINNESKADTVGRIIEKLGGGDEEEMNAFLKANF
jgi:CarD family transcriptional regulator